MSIEEIVALLRQKLAGSEAVSPGPWSELVDCCDEEAITPRIGWPVFRATPDGDLECASADVDLIVAMRNHLPALLDAIERTKDGQP